MIRRDFEDDGLHEPEKRQLVQQAPIEQELQPEDEWTDVSSEEDEQEQEELDDADSVTPLARDNDGEQALAETPTLQSTYTAHCERAKSPRKGIMPIRQSPRKSSPPTDRQAKVVEIASIVSSGIAEYQANEQQTRIDSPNADEEIVTSPLKTIPTTDLLTDLTANPSKNNDSNTQEARIRPRISDDTAILHAFLNRAAANRKQPSVSKRESLENQKDSNVVRQALASPAKAEVLAELDPNSPSPHKETTVSYTHLTLPTKRIV